MLSIPVTFLDKRSRLIAKAQYVADICLQGLYVSIENEYEASEDVRIIDVRFDRIEQLNRKVEQINDHLSQFCQRRMLFKESQVKRFEQTLVQLVND